MGILHRKFGEEELNRIKGICGDKVRKITLLKLPIINGRVPVGNKGRDDKFYFPLHDYMKLLNGRRDLDEEDMKYGVVLRGKYYNGSVSLMNPLTETENHNYVVAKLPLSIARVEEDFLVIDSYIVPYGFGNTFGKFDEYVNVISNDGLVAIYEFDHQKTFHEDNVDSVGYISELLGFLLKNTKD